MLITAERARELLAYDGKTGAFTRAIGAGKRWKAGQSAGTVNGQGYAQIRVDGRIYQAHRLAWLIQFGEWPVGEIDHINGDKLDNRIENLRVVSGSVNCQNLRASRVKTKAEPLGVTVVSGRKSNPYRARILVDGRSRSIGCFQTKEAAHAAYLNAKRQLHAGCTI